MTVRADDIALCGLVQDAIDAGATYQPRHRSTLRRGVAMVEVHRTWGKALVAVLTGTITQGVKTSRLLPPCGSLSRKSSGVARVSTWSRSVASLGSDPMTIGTDDIALRDLVLDQSLRSEHRAARRQSKCLDRPVAVIEVHLMRLEHPAAVGARSFAQSPQLVDPRSLPIPYARPFALAVRRVVGDIGCPLARSSGHGPV